MSSGTAVRCCWAWRMAPSYSWNAQVRETPKTVEALTAGLLSSCTHFQTHVRWQYCSVSVPGRLPMRLGATCGNVSMVVIVLFDKRRVLLQLESGKELFFRFDACDHSVPMAGVCCCS